MSGEAQMVQGGGGVKNKIPGDARDPYLPRLWTKPPEGWRV